MAHCPLYADHPSRPVKPGDVVHSTNCDTQAIVLVPYEASKGGPEREEFIVLEFSLHTGKRIFDRSNTANAWSDSAWHIAEYTSGMEVLLPAPSLTSSCLYTKDKLAYGETCECGCERTYWTCDCVVCDGDCGAKVDDEGDHCDGICYANGFCVCECDCENETHAGELCGSCEEEPLCTSCEVRHPDYDGGDLCEDCKEKREREKEEVEERT